MNRSEVSSKWNKCRIYVGDQLDRWNELKEVLRDQTLAEFANILLDSVRIAMATVYIWSSNIINKRPGHASLLLDTGTYISFWPQDKNKSKLFKTWFAVSQIPFERLDKYEDDVELEGYTADDVIEINRSKLNIEQIEEWWRTYIPVYHFFRNNCCDVVMEALKVGGAHSFVEPTRFSLLTKPNDVKQYCIELSQKQTPL